MIYSTELSLQFVAKKILKSCQLFANFFEKVAIFFQKVANWQLFKAAI